MQNQQIPTQLSQAREHYPNRLQTNLKAGYIHNEKKKKVTGSIQHKTKSQGVAAQGLIVDPLLGHTDMRKINDTYSLR